MIRQLGPASLFCSFSSAETQWIHLLRILGKLVDNKEYTNNKLENFKWKEKSGLIQSDPVTCARHFDYQINQFLPIFLLGAAAPSGKIALVLQGLISAERINSYSYVNMARKCSYIW